MNAVEKRLERLAAVERGRKSHHVLYAVCTMVGASAVFVLCALGNLHPVVTGSAVVVVFASAYWPR